jgi:hypothetical protein
LIPDLVTEAKALVALVSRNGPIEDLHAGRPCPACSGRPEISHITDEEMKGLMKSAVNAFYPLLRQREYDPRSYNENLALGRRCTSHWDDPKLKMPARRGSPPK